MEPKQIVRRFVDEAVNGGGDDLTDDIFAEDIARWARDWFGAFRGSSPDLHIELVEVVGEGDRVVARLACSATHLGEWRGHPPTGRRFQHVDEVCFFTITGDRTSAVWGIEDRLDRFRQLGLEPTA